ncbi:MAG: hypothetical protein HY815_22465 [Candidatus Riflebacteria bacterium]|nr:hypothetical protein [Candidatus Riflebacteria bacterium]
MNSTNGTFANALNGQTSLASSTAYWVRVSYRDGRGGDSGFSAASKFTTATGAPASNPPDTPSITAPTANVTDTSRNLTLRSNAFNDADAGDTHASSTWQVYDHASLASANLVWSKVGDATNLTSIVVDETNGVFSNSLAGQTALVSSTAYWARVAHTDNRSTTSSFSSGVRFWTSPGAWAKTYGGGNDDRAYDTRATADGGYIVTGWTKSFGAGDADVWVLKLDSQGKILWEKAYGGAGEDVGTSIRQTAEGGYAVAGWTASFGSGGNDVWVLKLDAQGNLIWQKTYGGAYPDHSYAFQQTSDGGYIVAADTFSFPSYTATTDVWLLKLDAQGNVIWQRIYGGLNYDWVYCVQQTTDAGYVVAGHTRSFGAGNEDTWILKLDGQGDIDWQATYGGTGRDWATGVRQTEDGGYVALGYTTSFGAGNYDVWLLKLDGLGNVDWQRTYGGAGIDYGWFIEQAEVGGFVVSGLTQSFGAGDGTAWLLKLDTLGNVAWQKTYGGAGGDWGMGVHGTTDGGYVMGGLTSSFGAGSVDAWLLKLDSQGRCAPLGVDTNAVITDTAVGPVATSVAPATTNCTITQPAVTVTDTQCTVMQQAP